jgi:peroxiredoxin
METFYDEETLYIGDTVPEELFFDVFYKDNQDELSFADLRGSWTVLFFYPADFTFVCPTELEELADLHEEFEKEAVRIVSMSRDTVFVHKAWHDQSPAIGKITFPMGSDPTGEICEMFGVNIHNEGVSLRGTFVIDPDGVIKSIEVNDNSIGRSAKELLRKIRAAKFVRENGGKVCPASWEPGGDTLEPGMDLVGKI